MRIQEVAWHILEQGLSTCGVHGPLGVREGQPGGLRVSTRKKLHLQTSVEFHFSYSPYVEANSNIIIYIL